MRIWAHRGCSQMYPENTLTSFGQAMKVPGIAGIELDVQLTRDGELVVIHDERIDRTTDGFGYVRDYTLKELKTFHIHTGNEKAEHIPTMREVLELLSPKLKKWTSEQADDPRINVDFSDGLKSQSEPGDLGMRLNIELKNSVYDYPSLEQKTIDMVHEFGVQDAIVYSTFYAESLFRVHEIDPQTELGMLDDKVSDCLYKARGLEKSFQRTDSSFAETQDSGFKFALHPFGKMMDINSSRYDDRIIRAWFTGHLYPEKPTGELLDVSKYEALGITDIFLNEPEKYLAQE